VTVRTVDDSQYENRLRSWDYDIIITSWAQSLSPGNEQRYYWGSASADQPGSRNYIGVKNAGVDALIERVIFARIAPSWFAATRALDRVLLWNHFVVPQWTYPRRAPRAGTASAGPMRCRNTAARRFHTIWWWDDEKAAKTRADREAAPASHAPRHAALGRRVATSW
jgi:microcin C transport system substrate-binding protein